MKIASKECAYEEWFIFVHFLIFIFFVFPMFFYSLAISKETPWPLLQQFEIVHLNLGRLCI